MNEPRLPLAGYRVVDFSWVFAGPTTTMILGALGAEVLKIESSTRPDTSRRLRRYADGRPMPVSGGPFDGMAFNKRSVSLDLSKPEAQELAHTIIGVSDVVVENFSHGIMERFGLGFERLRQGHPDLVMLSFSLFGRRGPDRTFFGFGGPLPAYTGLASITGYPGGTPRTVAASWPDPLNGVSAAFAIMAALHHRERTGQGQYIDLAMCEGGIVTLPQGLMDAAMNGRPGQLRGNHDAVMVPHNVYRCQGEDAWVAIAVGSEAEWQGLCRALGEPAWCREARFADRLARKRHEAKLDALIEAWTRERAPQEVAELLQREGVPAGPVLNRQQLLDEPHLRERGAFVEIWDNPGQNRRLVPAIPWRYRQWPVASGQRPGDGEGTQDSGLRTLDFPYERPPMLGEHTRETLVGLLGIGEAEVERLEAVGVLR